MGHCFQSPLRRWDVIVGLCQTVQAKTFVEVGCKEGRTTGHVLANCPDVQVYAIDPWQPVPNSAEDYKDWDFAAIERAFWGNVGPHKDRVTMLRSTSLEVAEGKHKSSCAIFSAPALPVGECNCSPRQFDVVFIDAAHDYDNVLEDIRAWWPLVRDGGFICGHDFNHKWPGVMRAVADAFPLMRVGVCPDSMWCVQKDSLLRLAA